MNNVRIFPDPDALADAMARRLRDESEHASRGNRVYSLVLTGGATADRVYRRFAAPGFGDRIPWKSVHLFWTDERCVAPEDEESNFGMAHRAFLDSISIPDENVHRIRGEADPATESARYAREIQSHLALRSGQTNFFDWVVMGLGTDGHTASLFPDQKALLRSPNLCEVVRHPQTNQERITLTPFALRSASITYNVIGGKKARVVSELLSGFPPPDYPAAHIAGEWYLDQAAASGLKLS